MSRLHEDPTTRRVVDTDSPAYRLGVQSANKLIESEYARIGYHRLSAEVLMDTLVSEDPDVQDHWGMYLMLKGMLDTIGDYRHQRST